MSPLSSISAFDNCLKSLPSGYNPTPLDEPSAAMGDTISAFMRQKVAVEHGAKLEGHELLRYANRAKPCALAQALFDCMPGTTTA